ncbi:MAG: sigma-70 family RNA polymerase sigma factor [Anaerolineae bacterium]|nr:sigma-70 family RNA polymerase sigma factor [Anaerolineae bacterium]
MDETAWIEQARAGDVEAFGLLVQMHQAHVYNLAYRMLGNRMEAEDAAQEAFLRAFKHLDRYDLGRPFRTWLLSIASHHCVDRLRRRRPTLPLDEVRWGTAGRDPELAAVRTEVRERVQRLLMRLPPTDRAAVTLRYWYDCSYVEIAEMLGLTVSAVKSRLHRARRAMAQEMREAG